jgi:hypothetical protein
MNISNTPAEIMNDCFTQLEFFTPGSDTFIDQVCELAATKVNLFSRMEDGPANMRALVGFFTLNLPVKNGVSTLEYIAILERLFGIGGPLHGNKIDHYSMAPNAQFIAAMYFIQAAPGLNDPIKQNIIQRHVTGIALEAGNAWKALRTQLELIDQAKPQARLVESIADLLQNLRLRFHTDNDAVLIQKAGGVERLKEIGADIDAICQGVLERIHATRLSHVGLPLVHRFIVDATSELHASSKITREVANERLSMMLVAVLNVRRNQKKSVHPCYREMMLELAPHMSKQHASELIPRLGNYLPLEELTSHLNDPLALINLTEFKKALNKHTDAGIQYDLVVKLGLASLFEGSELQKLKGQKLESALGL